MTKRLVGLDVGSYAIKVLQVEQRGRADDFHVVHYIEKKLEGVADPGDDATLKEAQSQALLSLKDLGIFDSGTSVVTALPASYAQMRSVTVPFTDRKKIDAVLPGMLDALVPFDVSDLVLSWFLKDHKSPDGENWVALAYTQKQNLRDYLQLLYTAGIDPRVVTFKPAPLYDLFTGVHNRSSEEPQALVDIGHSSTSICVVAKNEIVTARSLLYGGFDMTRALAETLGTSFEEAERHKMDPERAKQGFAAEAIKESLEPVMRELRHTNLQLENNGYPPLSFVHLFGGASRTANVSSLLSQALSLPCVVAQEAFLNRELRENVQLSTAAASLSYAVVGLSLATKAPRFNFRKGEFSYRGEYDALRQKVRPVAIWAAVLALSLLGFGVISTTVLGRELAAVQSENASICQSILGKPVAPMDRCLAQIKQQINGQKEFDSLEFSAVDIYLQIVRLLPKETPLKVTELEIDNKAVRLVGDTSNFEAVDQIVDALGKGHCFKNVEKGRARQSQGKVNFALSLTIDCSPASDKKPEKGPEKGKAKELPPSKGKNNV